MALLGLLLCCWSSRVEGAKGSKAYPSPGSPVAEDEPVGAEVPANEAAPDDRYPSALKRLRGAIQRAQPLWTFRMQSLRRNRDEMRYESSKVPRKASRHRALLLALLIGTAVLLRSIHLAISSNKFRDNSALRKRLQVWMELLEIEKAKLAKLKNNLAELQSANDHKEGLLQSQRLHIEQEQMLLRGEEEELKKKETRVEGLRETLEAVEREVARAQSVLEGRDLESERAQNRKTRGFRTASQAVDLMQQVGAAFDTAAYTGSRSKSRSAFSADHMELTTMRAAMSVLDSLPKKPLTSDQAKDILKARRLLLGAVVRCQAATWGAIRRLLQLKAEWQTEMLLEQSGESGLDNLSALAEEEWYMQDKMQERSKRDLKYLENQMQICLTRQQQLQERLASSEPLDEQEVSKLEVLLFHWENYELTVRARKALIMSTEAQAFTTREAFLRERLARVQRAFDQKAYRRRRLPTDSIRLTEIETSISAISEELAELKQIYDMAKNIRADYEYTRIEGEELPTLRSDKQPLDPLQHLEYEDKRRESVYSRPVTASLVRRQTAIQLPQGQYLPTSLAALAPPEEQSGEPPYRLLTGTGTNDPATVRLTLAPFSCRCTASRTAYTHIRRQYQSKARDVATDTPFSSP